MPSMGTMCAVWKYCWVSLWPWNLYLAARLQRRCCNFYEIQLNQICVYSRKWRRSDHWVRFWVQRNGHGRGNGTSKWCVQITDCSLLEIRFKMLQRCKLNRGYCVCLVSLSSTSDGGSPAQVAHGNQRMTSSPVWTVVHREGVTRRVVWFHIIMRGKKLCTYKLLLILTWQLIGMCCSHTRLYLMCAFQFVATTSDLQSIFWNMLKSITYSEPIFEAHLNCSVGFLKMSWQPNLHKRSQWFFFF